MNVRFSKNIIFCILLFNMQIMSPALVNGHVGGGGGSANAGAGLYSSTQRRGPIAAEFQGPGPAAVALPSTIGNIREMLSGGGMYIKCESYNLSRRESRGESVSDTSRPARCEQSYNRTLYIMKKPKKKKRKKKSMSSYISFRLLFTVTLVFSSSSCHAALWHQGTPDVDYI